MIAIMSENKQTTDSELLLQIVGYNSDAFEHLYNRYSAAIYSLIKEIVTSPKLAEKMLLNVFSVFLKRIDYYSTTSNDIFTWLTLLARNISVDALKRMKCVEDIPEYSDEYEIEFILPNLSQMITPINLDERTALGEKIKSYKSHLTEIQNLVLSLVYFEGLDEDEIAKRLSVPVATVRQKILSIMESLHHQYTGKTEDAKSNQKVLTLIKLDALGCLSSEEKTLLKEIKENDPDFLWKELGEYQNLTALLSTSIPIDNPRSELRNEIKDIFIKILQGDEVNYPVIKPATEINKQYNESAPKPEVTSEKHQKVTPEPVQQQIQTPAPEAIKPPEIQEKKKPEFEFKFRERDPKELSLLKKIESPELNQNTSTSFAKANNDVKIKDYNEPIKRPALVVNKKDNLPAAKESISIASKTESTILDKTVSVEINKSEIKIENDDPSIIIDKPKPASVKDEIVVKNRLIPNSSINLKELFKEEKRTVITKESNPLGIKEEKKVAENPESPLVSKSDIVIKPNEPPKELRRNNVFVNKSENILGSKPGLPTIEKSGIVNKINEPSEETQKTNTAIVKEENKVEEKPVVPVLAKSDIKIKTNEPPKEFRRSNVFVDQDQKIIPSKPATPVVEKSEFENKKNEQVREFQQTNTIVAKSGKPEEAKTPQVVKMPDTKTSVQEPINQTKKIIPEIKKDENIQEQIKPAIDRSNLKIRETVFTENEKKSKISKPEGISPVVQSKPKIEKANLQSALSEPVNIDEILSKIEDENRHQH